jgi:hypothetical protein
MKAYICLRFFIYALVFGLTLGSCASVQDGETDNFEFTAERAGWYGKTELPKKYITYLKRETVPLTPEKNSPVLEFVVDTLDVLDEI